MSIQVRNLLELPVYQNSATVLSAAGMDKMVRYLTVMETPDFHFDTIEKGTMILTTLSSYHQNIQEINRTIEGLCEADVAAIGIKLGRFISEVDDSTVAICRQHQVPLFAFDNTVYFRQVLSESLTYIANDQYVYMEKLISLENELSGLILKEGSLLEITDALCRRIPCICQAYNTDMELLSERSSLGQADKTDVPAVLKDIRSKKKNLDSHFINERELVLECRSVQTVEGYLYVKADQPLNGMNLPFIQSVNRAVSMRLMDLSIEEKAKSKLVESLLDDILFSGSMDEDLTASRLKLFDFTPLERHGLILLQKADHQVTEKSEVRIAQSCLARHLQSVIVFRQDDNLLAMLSFDRKKTDQQIQEDVKGALQDTLKELPGKYCAGVSILTRHLKNMTRCYKQARQAIQFGKTMNHKEEIYFYNDYLQLGLISHALETNTSLVYFKHIINPIREHDKVHNSNLWDTLCRCLNAPTLEKVSKDLYIHISTLRYRLEKIEILTGYNYFDPNDRMSLYLAYLLYYAELSQQK